MPTSASRASSRGKGRILTGLRHGYLAHRYSRGIPAWHRTNTDRSLARPPCPQLPQGHPGVAKSHLTKDKPVSARCKDRLSYRRAYRQTCRMVSYASLTDRQTGLPYRQPYLKLSPAGSHGSSLPDGFIRQTYRQVSFQRPDRPASPVARPAALPAASPASHTSQPNRPARPASLTSSPTGILTGHPHRPSSPAIHPGKGPAGLHYR